MMLPQAKTTMHLIHSLSQMLLTFSLQRCRKQSVGGSKTKEKVLITGTMYAEASSYQPSELSAMKSQLTKNTSTNIPKEPVSEVMLPLTLEKIGQEDSPPPSIKTKALTGGNLVPPPPSLKPMTVAAHLKSLQHEQKSKQTVVSWSFSEGNLKFTNTMPKPPPLKTIRAPLGQLPSLTSMPSLTSKPTTVMMSPTALGPTSGSIVRTALSNHLQHSSSATGASASSSIVPGGSSSDIRMAGQLLTLPGNIINRIKMNEPLALKINNQSLVVNPDCFVQTTHGVKIFLPPNTLPVQTGNKTINITVPQTSASVVPTTTVSHSVESTIQASSCTPVVVGGTSPIVPGGQKPDVPEMAKPAPVFTNTVPDTSPLKSVAPRNNSNLQSKHFTPDLPSQPIMIGQGLVPVKKDLPPSPVVPPKRTRRKIHGINPAMCFVKQLHGGYDSLLQIFSYLSVPDLLK
jgi:hypothetical protein